MNVRRPNADDADAMGLVHVLAWQAAYQSIMPAEYLRELRPEDRASMWRGQIEVGGGTGLLVVTSDDVVVGFAAFGPCHDDGSSDLGQIYAINLHPAHWGKGLGRSLLRAATVELSEASFRALVLWVVPNNARARTLYEAEGWHADGAVRDEDVLGATVTELRYRRILS